MPRRTSISEGWEEVSDDDFSVISAPGTDDEAEALSHSEAGISKPTRRPSPHPKTTAPIPISRPPALDGAAVECPPAISNPTGLPSVAPLDHPFLPTDRTSGKTDKNNDTSETRGEDDPSNPFNAEEYQYESDDAVEELLDSHPDPDPAFFLRVLRSLSEIITETNQSSKELMPFSGLSHRVSSVCGLLSMQVDELIPIVSNYSRLWSVASRDIPLDPNLHGWMSGVRVKLLGLQAEMQRHARAEVPAADTVALQEYHAALSEYQSQMQDFLPIMQVDYNEFQTQQMNFPTLQGGAGASTAASRTSSSTASTSAMPIPIRNAQPRQPCRPTASSDMWVLRQELYRLKDEMQRTIELLSDCVSALPSSGAGLASDVIQSYGALFNTVTLILSNHGSDWIEHGLSGGLTYAEFTQLDIVSVRDFRARLAQIWEALAVEHLRGCGSWSAQMVENHRRHMLMDEGQLDRLETLAEVLTATLNPERNSGSTHP